jgi:membrane-associated protease RseP (regulator of RpoE activity)
MAEVKENDRKWIWIVVVAGVVVSLILACCAGGLAGLMVYKWAERDAARPDVWRTIPDAPSIERVPRFQWPEEGAPAPTPFSRVESGAVLTEVVEGSPAEEAGLRVGDVILSVDDRWVTDEFTLYDAVTNLEPGTPIEVQVWSHGQTRTVRIRLGENPDDRNLAWLGVGFVMMDIPDSMRRSDESD